MATPAASPEDGREQYSFPAFPPNQQAEPHQRRSSDEDGTLRNEDDPLDDGEDHNRLHVMTSYAEGSDNIDKLERDLSPMSITAQREASRRLDDDLEMLRAERVVSNAENSQLSRGKSMQRSRSRTAPEPVDDFDVGTTPLHEKAKVYQPPEHPATNFAKLFKKIHNSSFLVRYFIYITPPTLLLLVPVLLGFLMYKTANVGGVRLAWFGIWLEILWLTLWAGRVSPLEHVLMTLLTS